MKKRSRSTGSDVVTYLKEMRSQIERDTELESAQQDLTNLLQQIRHQQEQTQQLIQQQQMNAFLSILSKFAEKWGKTFIFFIFASGFLQILSHHCRAIKVNQFTSIHMLLSPLTDFLMIAWGVQVNSFAWLKTAFIKKSISCVT